MTNSTSLPPTEADIRSDAEFTEEVRDWMAEHLRGEFAPLRFRGGPGDEHALVEQRMVWERELASGGWTCVGWPKEHGGRGLPLRQEVIFHEEYSRAGGPGRAGLIGEGLLGPTLIHFANPALQQRFLPGIVSGTEFWCQGYSEPNAGSDLANVQTRAELDGDEWVVNGQKVWTSLAQWSDWCFVLCRTDRDAPKHKGISYLLMSMSSPGISVVPIRQITGTAEFNEVFFDNVRVPADQVVGQVNGGWKVAMGTLAFERGALTLGQQMAFQREYGHILDTAKQTGRWDDPNIRQRLSDLWIRIRIMRWNAERTLAVDANVELVREAMIHKLYWANLHQDMGELAMDVLGNAAMLTPYADIHDDGSDLEREMDTHHKLFFFSRSDTIYGGSNEVQRNLIGERALGLPREPR
jgi:alkylation response protein AidB-like acyl-CoA dehydrogenase